ncbi:MAG TPA: hypothetical protein VK752_08105 [Bryobacteraceae bacterium]|nr:hypothetical protein [Bryobacteraceae bacterium]
MKKRLIVLACCLASTALAQLGGGYLGPAILSSGATGVGNRSGQVMDLRFFAGVDGVYQSSFEPVAVDSKGQLITIGGLYGVSANLGLYGTHSWKTAQLGVDYTGVFRDYLNASSYSGIDQYLTLGYTWQESRRLTWKANLVGGILDDALGGIGVESATVSSSPIVVSPSTLLFDSRSYYLQGGLNMTYQQTARTSYTIGAQGFDVWRQSPVLVGMEGYSAQGAIEHKLTRNTSVGFTYQRQHFHFPKVFGQADVDTGEFFIGTKLGPLWTFSLHAGILHSEVSGLQTVALNPVIAALLGQASTVQAFYREDFYPSGTASLSRRFKQASLNFYYSQLVSPGNGIYLTSKSENGGASYSYTGIRKVSLSISGGYNELSSLGQGIPPYRTGTAGAGMTYSLPWSLHFVARYDYRLQEIENIAYKNNGYSVEVGLSFSPGRLPLSLW